MASASFINPFDQGDGEGAESAEPDRNTEPTEHPEPTEPTEPDLPFPDFRFAHEDPSDPISAAGMGRNARDVAVGTLAAPGPGTDVEDHVARVQARLGGTRFLALTYCDIGTTLRRMPTLAAILAERPFLPMAHLAKIAQQTLPVSDEFMPDVERELLRHLAPTREGQAMIGAKALGNRLRRTIEFLEPDARPIDEDEPPPPSDKKETLAIDDRDEEFTGISAAVRADKAREMLLIIDAIARARDCTRTEALYLAVKGECPVGVTVNIYRDVLGGPAWMSGVGWLDEVATREWTGRITGIRISSNGTADGYTPTEAMAAFLEGRDGTCRFPNCEHPAHRCDKDHVHPYDHDNPADGGPTATGNLHSLCRRHHNLKTAGLWDVEAHPDGTEVWSSADGAERIVTVPEGPLAGFGRRTFDQRTTRMAATLREHNERRREAMEAEIAETALARAEAIADWDAMTGERRAELLRRAIIDPDLGDWLREVRTAEAHGCDEGDNHPPF